MYKERDIVEGGRAKLRWLLPGFIGVLAFLVLVLSSRPVSAGGSPIVRCEPLVSSGTYGQTIVVDMYIRDVVDLYGVQLRASFDPSIVQVVDADIGFPGTQIQPIYDWLVPGFIVERNADNIGGIVSYSGTQLTPTLPVNGSGSVARITFQTIAAGTFDIIWDDAYVLLSEQGGVPIPSTNIDCTVTVNPVPTNLVLAKTSVSRQSSTAAYVFSAIFICLLLVSFRAWTRTKRS